MYSGHIMTRIHAAWQHQEDSGNPPTALGCTCIYCLAQLWLTISIYICAWSRGYSAVKGHPIHPHSSTAICDSSIIICGSSLHAVYLTQICCFLQTALQVPRLVLESGTPYTQLVVNGVGWWEERMRIDVFKTDTWPCSMWTSGAVCCISMEYLFMKQGPQRSFSCFRIIPQKMQPTLTHY